MQVIYISKGAFVGGEELATRLAAKLGYPSLSREELAEAATRDGIQVGKLEMALTRRSSFSERLALERDLYIAFVTARVCDRAMNGGLVYHGRTGHLILSGISHALRVRVVSSDELRIRAAMHNLGLDRNKARIYLERVDEDWRRWFRSLHGVSWEDTATYDVILNLEQMNVDNAAAALTGVAQLPDFQVTPASRRAMLDLRLAAHCRLALGRDDRTHPARFKVRADSGLVTVSYLPHDARYAEFVPEILSGVEGVRKVLATMATTNILWIQEAFEPSSETYGHVVEIATKWNAAVELVRLEEDAANGTEENVREDANATVQSDAPPGAAPAALAGTPTAGSYNGGIEDDDEPMIADKSGLSATLEELARIGRSGGARVISGGGRALLSGLDRSVPYSLVVLGELFSARGHAAKVRMKRELQSFLGDSIKAPVVGAEDLKIEYLFQKRNLFRALGLLVVTAVLYLLVFTHQREVLRFVSGSWWTDTALGHIAAAAGVFLVVPFIAYCYGSFAKQLLKLIKIE